MKTKLLFLLLLASFSIHAQTNLVPNGDFETWTASSQPSNWYRYFSGFISQSTTAQNGTSSTNMMISSGTFNYINSEYFPVTANKTYRVTLYHKVAKGTFTSVDLSLYHKPGTIKEEIIKKSDVTFSTSEWKKIEFEYTPKVSENIEVDIWTNGSLNSEILIDNVSVVDVAETPFQYTLIPDINFEKKLIALGIESGTPDGKILTSKIDKITEIDLYFSNITDLTGIQDFKSLKSLSCMSNKLTSLDISQNLALTYLNAGYNKLTTLNTSKNIVLRYVSLFYNQITNLDVSKNVNLGLLSVDSNQLTNIDVSNNKGLFSLSCSSNQLTNLDLSKNSSLENLTCSENKLLTSVNLKNGNNRYMQIASYTINFTENPLLSCIIVDDPLYSNKNWGSFKDASAIYSTIDCSQVTAIPDPAFEDKLIALNIDKDGKNGTILNSSIENRTSLDVSSSAIKDLTGIKGFKTLNTLNCSGNLLSSLNLSQNITLTLLNCSNNPLESLDLKNGNNKNLDLNSNFKNNPNLNCIQVDNDTYANTNWTTLKDGIANYNVNCTQYTLIPDSNFEDKLIALKIDNDGKNGKVVTANIRKVTTLDLSSSNISDLSGIEDFTELTLLNCNYNSLSRINVQNNKALSRLDLRENKLTSLDVTQNKKLVTLIFSKNQISSIDLSQNKELQILSCDENLLTQLDLSSNTLLGYLDCGSNNLTALDVSKHPNLRGLYCTYTTISKLDVTSNPNLESLYFNNAQLTTLDLSKNPLLESLNVSWNQLTTLDISKNPLLTILHANSNQLTSLNLKNGKNSSLNKNGITFKSNPKLQCILVDDVTYANTNWSGTKDAFATYNTECTGELNLPANNFTIETKSESCLGENNGEISITGKATFAYTATINDKPYTFANNSLNVKALTPGSYKVKITIPDVIFEQNFTVNIAKGATITGKSSVTAKTVNVEITEGTAPFTVFVNGTEQFQTDDAAFTVDVTKNGLVEVATAKACEGIFAKKVSVSDFESQTLSAYPNPTSGSFEIEIPGAKDDIKIELYNFSGQLVSTQTYTIENGKVLLNLDNQPSGIYAAKIYLETPEYIKIIKK
ncbi:T9SS type A sorting domain-containing protein [Flavobacterium sp.]|uniref:T9SS type A sorting domain-containing protein n=1 Tax=Flavobacterium sp. TaxID=239 RepID=UPI0025B80C10|nr:T9SS type A sorting domain-containing protein [Flavobacterium sp.]